MRLSPLSSPLSSQNGLPVETDTDSDITTAYQYDSSGRMVTMTAYDAKGAGNGVTAEATKYLYTSAVDASLQTAEVDPDSTDVVSQDPNTLDWSITSGTDHTSTTYGAQNGTGLIICSATSRPTSTTSLVEERKRGQNDLLNSSDPILFGT
jgi:YD repeat-containing protein